MKGILVVEVTYFVKSKKRRILIAKLHKICFSIILDLSGFNHFILNVTKASHDQESGIITLSQN